MEPKRPFLRPTAIKCMLQTVSSFHEGEEAGRHRCLEQLLSGPTTECQHLSLRTQQEHGSIVHEAISQRNMNLLKHLVHCHKASLEERDNQGLMPLYNAVYSNWPEGALLLLEHGANVNNAESIPQNLCFSHESLIHLAVKTGSQQLVRELIKRGASIRVIDLEGDNLVWFHGFLSREVLFQCLASSVTTEGSRRPDLLRDLLFVVSIADRHPEKRQQVVEFIRSQPECHQSKMFDVFAACLSFAVVDNSPLLYWKMSTECKPCQLHDHTAEEEMAPRSVFADIMDVQEHPLPDKLTTDEDKLAVCIHALLAIEKYIPEDKLLLQAGLNLHILLRAQKKTVSAIGVLSRLTTIRPLCRFEASMIQSFLSQALNDPDNTKELPLSAVLDSMKTIQNCLSSLQVSCSKAQVTRNHVLEQHLDTTLQEWFNVLLQTIKYHYDQKVLTTPEGFEDLTLHIKDFLQHFPSTICRHAFHLLAQIELKIPKTASMIKDLVAYSAEVRGTVQQKDSPLHLLSDENGDTPLHCLARHGSQEDLVQEGVLKCFLDHGAHLCTRNNQGETVRSILVARRVCTQGELLPSLQCLAAAAFMGDGRLRQTVENCRPAAVRNFLLDH